MNPNKQKPLTAEEAYKKTIDCIKGYESGDLLGGNPYSWIEKYARETASLQLSEVKQYWEEKYIAQENQISRDEIELQKKDIELSEAKREIEELKEECEKWINRANVLVNGDIPTLIAELKSSESVCKQLGEHANHLQSELEEVKKELKQFKGDCKCDCNTFHSVQEIKIGVCDICKGDI